jgi:hypothetical protein
LATPESDHFQERIRFSSQESSRNVMLDPSLLLDIEKLRNALNFVSDYRQEFKFYIPNRFDDLLSRGESAKRREVENFFEVNPIDWSEIAILIERDRPYITTFSVTDFYYRTHSEFHESIRLQVESDLIKDILFEEWVFLQEYSWIIAKIKKTFETFKKAGASSLELSSKAFERLFRRTLKMGPDDPINRAQKLRAVAKWMATGAGAGSMFLAPYVAFGVVVATGYFTLIDPE